MNPIQRLLDLWDKEDNPGVPPLSLEREIARLRGISLCGWHDSWLHSEPLAVRRTADYEWRAPRLTVEELDRLPPYKW